MAWDINERGTIDLTPLMDWETSLIHETGCGLRLVFVRHQAEPQKDPLVVQTILTIEQAELLSAHLLEMVQRIRRPPSTPPN
jgi:hypothetical protein